MSMSYLYDSEVLLYLGVTVMVIAVISAILCIVIFNLTGRKLKRTLEQEYGKTQRWN